MPLPRLTWVLCDQAGTPLSGGHVATNRRLIAARNRSMEARLSLSLHDQVAISLFAVLQNGIPQLRVYLGTELVFSGNWTSMRGANSVDSASSVEMVFKDPFDRLSYRYTDGLETFVQIDAGMIAHDLIETAQLGTQLNIKTDPAFIEPTMLRDRSYYLKQLGEAITELTQVIAGFDWYPVYLDPRGDSLVRMMEFHVTPSLGTDLSNVIFEYGEGTKQNCTSYSFTTGLPVNWVLAIGTGDPAMVEPASDIESNAKYLTYQTILSATDVSESVTLQEKAGDALRLSPVHVTEFKPDPAVSPLPWRDFWIGDVVRWNVDDGAMQQQLEPRVQTIEVGVDDSDNISDLVVGIDPESSGAYMPPTDSTRSYVQRQREILRRLSALER